VKEVLIVRFQFFYIKYWNCVYLFRLGHLNLFT